MAKVRTRIQKEIPRTYMTFIGGIIFYWATIEHILVEIIGTALRFGSKERRIVLTKMDAKAKIAMLRVIGSKYTKNRNTREKINNLATACHGFYDFRNICAHSAWVSRAFHPYEWEMMIIDSGETAFLPKLGVVNMDSIRKNIEDFKECLEAAIIVRDAVLADFPPNEPDDSDSSVAGAAEGDT